MKKSDNSFIGLSFFNSYNTSSKSTEKEGNCIVIVLKRQLLFRVFVIFICKALAFNSNTTSWHKA